jgi:hypothetical protein
MTVKQLIDLLQQQDPEHFAMISNRDGVLDDVVRVEQTGPSVVEIKTKPAR